MSQESLMRYAGCWSPQSRDFFVCANGGNGISPLALATAVMNDCRKGVHCIRITKESMMGCAESHLDRPHDHTRSPPSEAYRLAAGRARALQGW